MFLRIRFSLIIVLCLLSFASCEKEEESQDDQDDNEQGEEQETAAKIGEFRGGGIVFWINESDSTQGLVVATNDLLASAQWGCYGKKINGANRTNLFGGEQNTKDIISGCNFVNIAADLCDEAVDNGYSDWYLPNTREWNEIIGHLDTIEAAAAANGGKVFYDHYWTSNQPTNVVGETLANAIHIRDKHLTQERKDDRFAVRAIRAFE